MQYQPFQDLQLSALGMGNMRLPTGEDGIIDEEKARGIIEQAYHSGINYFDTAYRYHGGQSESFVGKVLAQFPRDSWYIASKMPGHMMNYENGQLGFVGYLAGEKIGSIAQIFEEQLQKCGVEYFDFYLLHNVCETSYDFYTNEELGVVRYLQEQKRAGKIRHLGFSAHGMADNIGRFLDVYPGVFEFAQIQINYIDWDLLQEAGEKYRLLTERGIPVIAMEPVRGGKLAELPQKAKELLETARPGQTDASWAFRFLQSLDNMQVVLSGMSTMEQLEENIALFSDPKPVTEGENKLLRQVVDMMVDSVPCTKCRYCCEECPQGLDIPMLLSLYDQANFSGMGILNFNIGNMKEEELPGACIGCGACSAVCPQNIEIPQMLGKLDAMIAGAKK